MEAWVEGLQLPYRISMYGFHHGNNLGTTRLVWKLPVRVKDRDQAAEVNVLSEIRALLPVYSTRAMRMEFLETYQKSTKQQPAVLRNLYRFLTGDAAAPETAAQAAVDSRTMEFLLDADDTDLVFDLRKNNGILSAWQLQIIPH